MKIKIKHSDLFRVLNHSSRIIAKHTTIPILANILIDAESVDNAIKIATTDLEMCMIGEIKSEILEKGSTTVSGKLFLAIIEKLSENDLITLYTEAKTEMLVIETNASQFKLPVLPAENFPDLRPINLEHNFVIKAEELEFLLKKTQFAMSMEETRYYLNGVFLHVVGDDMHAVATDGRRMAKVTIDAPKDAKNVPAVIIARKTVEQILRIIKNDKNKNNQLVKIGISDIQISIQYENIYLFARLVDGNYPDYNNIFTENNENFIKLDLQCLHNVVDRVAVLSSEATNSVQILVDKDKMHIFSEEGMQGKAHEEINVQYDGEKMLFGFRAEYLKDVAENISNPNNGEMYILKPDAPVLIKPEKSDKELFIIMPMRIKA